MATREENLKTINDKLELLSDEDLEQVAGGNAGETRVDIAFFQQLGYDMSKINVSSAYNDNGVQFSERLGDNNYKLLKSDGWTSHPHWAAMGYVLAKKNYPGFNGEWWNADTTIPFLKEHFHISNFG